MPILDKIHYVVSGDSSKPRLVFLHGLLGSAANWRRIASAFEKDFEVLCFDQRGHGRSFHPDSGYAPEDFAQDLENILDELGWSDVLLVGHSMGGRNALQFAAQSPQRVKLLVIEDIGPESNEVASGKTRNMIEMVPTPFKDKKTARLYFQHEFAQNLPDNPQAHVLAQYFYTNIKEQPDGSADWRFSKSGVLEALKAGHEKARWVELESLKMPTLVIRGENSKELTPEVFMKMGQSNPQIETVEVAEAGHWVHFDQIEVFIRVLQQFFSKHGF